MVASVTPGVTSPASHQEGQHVKREWEGLLVAVWADSPPRSTLETIHLPPACKIHPLPSATASCLIQSLPWLDVTIEGGLTPTKLLPSLPTPFPPCPTLCTSGEHTTITSSGKPSSPDPHLQWNFLVPGTPLTDFFQSVSSFQIQLVSELSLVYLFNVSLASTLLVLLEFWLSPFVLVETLKAARVSISPLRINQEQGVTRDLRKAPHDRW